MPVRVVHNDKRRLTHTMTVQAPPEPDYEIANVNRYDASIHVADWMRFTWRSRVTASRFTVSVRFQQGAFFTTCTERWYNPTAGAQTRELSIPSVCGADEQWSTVTIEPTDGRTCEGCGTFRRTDLPDSRNLSPAEEANAVREEHARRDIRQFVRVRQALVRAEARTTTVTALLDNPRIGVIHLDRRGRIMAVNDRARSILRHGDGLSDRDGMLRARAPADRVRLERQVGDALPISGAVAVSGSMLLRRSAVLPPFVVHVKPVGVPQPDYGARHVAGLVLIVEPGRHQRVDPGLVATILGLTPAEGQVAVWLAEGKSVRDMAEATGHTEGAIYWHLKQIYRKHSISRQVDLVRLVLSLAELG